MVIKKLKKDKEKELKHKARRLSIKEGIYASAKASFGDKYLSPFAIAINASNSLVAILGAITGFIGPLGQVFGSKLMNHQSRKKIITKYILREFLVWFLFIGIAILFYKEIIPNTLSFLLLIVFILFTVFSSVIHPPLFSWIGDIVDDKFKGRWLSKRTLITNFVSIITAIVAAVILDFSKKNGWEMVGFILLFLITAILRFVCYKNFKKQYYPKIKITKKDYFSFKEFIQSLRKTNFGKFTLYRTSLALACSITSPLIAIYLLRTLEFNYISYMIIILSATVYTIVILNLWGKIIDKYGSYKVILITSILIPTIPFLWTLFPSKIYLILVPSLIGGIAWSGFSIAESKFIYDNVKKEKRGLAVSYYNLTVGIGVLIGAGISAILIKYVNTLWIKPIILIFFIGGFLRMIVVFFGLKNFKEIKKSKKIRRLKDFEKLIIKEMRPTLIEEAHEIISIKNYLREKE